MQFRTETVGDMLEGFMNNMSEDQIDRELKLFGKIAKELKIKDYSTMGVLIDEDHLIDKDMTDEMESMFGYRPYRESNQASGFAFFYFETGEHAEIAAGRFGPCFEE